MPAPEIATVERVNTAFADRLHDHASIDIVGMPGRCFERMVRARRIGLPQLDHGADRAVEGSLPAAAAGKPFVHFRRQAVAARDQRGLVVRKEFQIRALGRESGLDGRPRRAPDRHASVPH
jgi:hypothetical protein